MGLYRSLRPLVFAASPETAHRLATNVLGWPLPWSRIGGAVDDPSLRTSLAGIELRNPVGLAAGFDKTCRVLGALGSLGFGYVVGGTITSRPREGNPTPRIARFPSRGAMVNSMGLPNPGPRAAAEALSGGSGTAPRFVSVADEGLDEVLVSFALLEPHADAIELNASCPNVSWGRDRDTEEHLRDLTSALAERTDKPLIVKVPPFTPGRPAERDAIVALAGAAAEAGAAALTCSNTRPVLDARQSVGRGGLSGRPLFDGTLEALEAVRGATGLPVNACGGITTAADALACLEAGATTVQIYTALIYEGPRVLRDLTAGLANELRGRRTTAAALAAA
ncbi:MAG TPA: dihydroorotate dehydrogenase 2 [Actinomycetota bacterium]|nr:dihydroorotate dehydrogenase 2 [Actinomycetota bacterium]